MRFSWHARLASPFDAPCRSMSLEELVNHGGHGEHGAKQEAA